MVKVFGFARFEFVYVARGIIALGMTIWTGDRYRATWYGIEKV